MPWPLTESRCHGCGRLVAACICNSSARGDQGRALSRRLPRGSSGATGGERRTPRKSTPPTLAEFLFGKPKPKRRRRR